VPPQAPQGAGVFCCLEDGRYLFALYDETRGGGKSMVCGRIGGRRNAGETWQQCVEREVMEETGCRAVVESSVTCFFADVEGRPVPIAVEDTPRPALISRQPAAGAVVPGGIYYNLCFWARLEGEPRPGPELDALAIIAEPLLRRMACEELTLRELMAGSAEVIAARELNTNAQVTLGRSTQVLLEILDCDQG
jgi:ADP-ribose pyrophosphatase YjhB (NUDIX family)